jgi:hypothetical protein
MLKFVFAAAMAVSLVGCAALNSVSLTPIPKDRSKQISAEVSKTIFLAFSFDNDYVDPLISQLKAKCPQGIVTGILTKDEVIHYVIVHTHRVTATGYCLQAPVASAQTPAVRGKVTK